MSQRAGVTAWSRRTANGDFELIVAGRLAPIPPADWPFDVTLGTAADGHVVAVYSRGGVVHVYDPETQRERRLPQRGFQPAIYRGIVAVAAAPGGTAVDIVAGGHHRLATLRASSDVDVTGLAYDREGLAVAAYLAPHGDPYHGEHGVWVARPGEPLRRAASGGTGEENDQVMLSPGFAGDHLFWAYANHRSSGRDDAAVVRLHLRTGQTRAIQVEPRLLSVAPDSARPSAPLLYAVDPRKLDLPRHSQLRRLQHPRWRPFVQRPRC